MDLTVVIPTHNRARYAVPTIQALLSIGPNIEIVVSDTSDTDQISSALPPNAIQSGQVKIIRAGRKLNVVENFELGLQASSGKYLCFIGDDDFVDSSILDVVKWAESSNVDAVKTTMPAHYYWPDFVHKRRGDYYAASVFVAAFSGARKVCEPMKELMVSADNLGAGVLGMPRAYAGLISRKLAERIVAKYGSLFGGVSPDIYSAALISREAEKCVEIDYPFIVPGSSGSSTAGLSANGKHVGKLRENPHIGAFMNLVWNPLVPEFYSIQTVWGYSFIEALNAMGYDSRAINFPRLYAKCLMFHRNRVPETMTSIKAYAKKFGHSRAYLGLGLGVVLEAKWVVAKVAGIVKARFVRTENVELRNLPDAMAAMAGLSAYLRAHPLDLNNER